MLTRTRHRYLTRWPRRLAFAFLLLLVLVLLWRAWHILHPAPVPRPVTLTA